MATADRCALCNEPIEAGGGYVVRIDVFADPELPVMSGEQIASTDLDQTLAEVIEQAKNMTAEELQDGVHRRFEYRLCPTCHRRYLTNPLGLPRNVRPGNN